MAIKIECPNCKKRLPVSSTVCMNTKGKGCGTKLSQGTKIYWVSYRDPDGKKKRKRIGPSKKAAENFERKVKTDITENKYIDRREIPKVLIKDFAENSYDPWCKANNRGYRTKKRFIAQVVKLWGDKYLHELSNKDIEQYKWRMKKKRVAFNRILSTISHMYSIAIEFEQIDRQPFTTAKKRYPEKSRLRYLMPDEVNVLLDHCEVYLHAIVTMALHTGARKSEILRMRLGENVDLDKRIITFDKTKNDEVRHIPINDTLLEELSRQAEGKKPGDYMFCRKDGTPFADVRKSFSSALKYAGIEDFHFHDLRHTFASNLIMDGVDLFTLKELLGHKDIKMTMKYAHLAPEHKSKALKVLDRVFAQKRKAKIVNLGGRIGGH